MGTRLKRRDIQASRKRVLTTRCIRRVRRGLERSRPKIIKCPIVTFPLDETSPETSQRESRGTRGSIQPLYLHEFTMQWTSITERSCEVAAAGASCCYCGFTLCLQALFSSKLFGI